MQDTIRIEGSLSRVETDLLRVIVSHMIPASSEHDVPGADDAVIFSDIVRSLGREEPAIKRILSIVDQLSNQGFAELDPASKAKVITTLRQDHALLLSQLVTAVTRCYYRDDRVMRSLDMEPRPPFPRGFEVTEGDWSLLDPVRARGPIWRKV